MTNYRNVYISLATSMSKTGKFQVTPLVEREFEITAVDNFEIKAFMIRKGTSTFEVRI